MQIEFLKNIIDNASTYAVIIPLYWAGFVCMDYLYERSFCKLFGIKQFVRKEYKTIFHPRYLISAIRCSIFLMILLYFIELSRHVNSLFKIIFLVIFLIVIITLVIICVVSIINNTKEIKNIANLDKQYKHNGNIFKKSYKRNWLLTKFLLLLFATLTYFLLINIFIEEKTMVTIIILSGPIVFYFIIYNCYVIIHKEWVCLTIEYLNVIENDKEETYAIMVPNAMFTNDVSIACRTYFFKKTNGLTEAYFDLNNIRIFNSDEDIITHRYEVDYISTFENDGFDHLTETKAREYAQGDKCKEYYKNKKWNVI